MTNKGLKSTVDKGGQLEVLQYGTNMTLDYLLYYKNQFYCTVLRFTFIFKLLLMTTTMKHPLLITSFFLKCLNMKMMHYQFNMC